jgi:hypothetical protein
MLTKTRSPKSCAIRPHRPYTPNKFRVASRKIERRKTTIYCGILMAALSWRASVSRALVAGVAANASSSRRTACWEGTTPPGQFHYYRQSRSALAFHRRGLSDDSHGPKRYSEDEPGTTVTSDHDTLIPPVAAQSLSRAARSARQLRSGVSRIFSALGFVSSSTTSLFTDRDQIQRLGVTVEAFQKFLSSSGIDVELSESLNLRLLDNLIILGRVQTTALGDTDIRDLVAPTTELPTASIPPREEWHRYMRYATAAYGPAMIRAAEMDVTGRLDTRFSSKSLIKTRMSEHVGIPEEDMAVMDVDYDGDSMHLRYFVAVDHAHQKVVLAIRGTFSLSEIICDVAAFSRPFCGGEAHSEMATVAERTWGVVGPTLLTLLEKNPSYELIFTGHSLGAGCAALLNIMCHQNNNELVGGRPIRCFAYACPPVFAPLGAAPLATRACTSFINEMDAVPFLSVDSVRHFFASLRAIEELNLPWRKRMTLVTGFAEPDEEVAEAVAQSNRRRLKPKDGAPVLCVPAQATIWIREKEQTGTFDAKICDSEKISRTPIQIDIDMLQDHFVSRYEHVLHHLEDP